jgi:5-methylcytosine-specific restriction enzyme subunit McrC
LNVWPADASVVALREHEVAFADADLVASFSNEAWEGLGLRVQRILGDPSDRWRVAADKFVGVARLESGGRALAVHLRPKLDADIFFLADYAYGAERDLLADRDLVAELDALRDDPAACLLAWYLAEVESFARRWLRRDYVLRREVFEGRVRGRLLLAEYVGRYLSQGRAATAPCQFFELTPNNLANQILRGGVRYVARVLPQLPLAHARDAIRRRVDRVLPLLAGIAEIRVRPDDFNRLRLRGAMRHYGPLIRKTRILMQSSYLEPTPGAHAQDAFLWDMSILFQEAVRGILSDIPGVTPLSIRASARIVDGDGVIRRRSKIDPDYVLEIGGQRVVLDAKYKDVLSGDAADIAPAGDNDVEMTIARTRIRIRRADVYQAVAYGAHEKLAPASAALVFPVVLRENEALPETFEIQGFGERVSLLFIDVGPYARASAATFRQRLLALGGEADAAEPAAKLVAV